MRSLFAIPLALCFLSIAACGGSGGSTAGPTPVAEPESMSILAIGDSYFEFHFNSEQSIPDEIGKVLGQTVSNRAIGGAMIVGDNGILDIRDQYDPGGWEWVVMDGGGNDLNDRCGCNACDAVMEELISSDASSGEIPALVERMHQEGNKVVFMMYPELPPGAESGFDRCEAEFTELELRVSLLADNTQDLWLVSAKDVVPTGDSSYFETDLVHPSPKATEVIGQYIAQTIQDNSSQ